MPLTYLGVYADAPSANTTTSATSLPAAVQSSKAHTATFRVGETPLGIHATWGPTSCEVPDVAYDPSTAAVSIDGGASACAGPGTVARLGTFSVNVQPFETAVPVVTVTGTNPNGAPEQRVQVGNAETFPALANPSVRVQLCEPLEFGGAVTDTVHNASLTLDGSMIDQFASAPAGAECAAPGYYKVGTKVDFQLPGYLQQAVRPRTIENPSLDHGNCLSYEAHGSPGACAQTLPAAGAQDWEVDGVQAGPAPSVTLTADDPQHEVGLQLNVACDRLELDVRSNGYQAAKPVFDWSHGYYNYESGYAGPGMFDTATSCPVSPSDAGVSLATADSGDRGFPNYRVTTVGYYLPGDAVQLERPTNPGDTCRYEQWTGLQDPQPNNNGYPAGGLNGRQIELSGPLYAYLPAGSGGDLTLRDDWCGGYQFHSSAPCLSVTCTLDSLLNSDLLPALQSYVVDPAKIFYNRLAKLVTTNPITSPKSFFTQLGEAAALYVVSALPGGASFVTAAGGSDFFSSPGALLNTLEQSGRLATAQTVAQTFTYGQALLNESGVGEVLSGADSVIVLTADALDKAGVPNGVVAAIRYGRALTNGLSAISTCSSSAAAGDTPPSTATNGAAVTVGRDAYGVAKALQRFKEPTALKTAATALRAGGTLSAAARTYAAGVRGALNDVKLSTTLAQVSVLHNFDGANVNWTPDDFASCLAANTYALG